MYSSYFGHERAYHARSRRRSSYQLYKTIDLEFVSLTQLYPLTVTEPPLPPPPVTTHMIDLTSRGETSTRVHCGPNIYLTQTQHNRFSILAQRFIYLFIYLFTTAKTQIAHLECRYIKKNTINTLNVKWRIKPDQFKYNIQHNKERRKFANFFIRMKKFFYCRNKPLSGQWR
jgi:hypothetical protein